WSRARLPTTRRPSPTSGASTCRRSRRSWTSTDPAAWATLAAMTAAGVFHFGPFVLEPAERRLTRDSRPIALTPKAFDLLVLLVAHAGHAVGKDEILQALWPG